MRTPFLGPAYKAKSSNIAANRLINLYPEIVEVDGAGKDVGSFVMAPGLDLLATVGTGPIRGAYAMPATSTVVTPYLIVVSGNTVYLVNPTYGGTATAGTINTSSGPVSIIGNIIGTTWQVAIFDGNAGWLAFIAGTLQFQQLNLPFSSSAPYGPPAVATYQDTFGLLNVVGTNLWYQSNPGDLSTWAALDYSAADSFPDNVQSLVSIHNEIWLLKQFDTEIWYDAGNAGFSFSRLQGTFIESGCAAPFSVAKGGEALFWLSQNAQGQGVAVMATGYQPVRISTHPLEADWQAYATISDAIAWCYQQEGHLFYVLTFPTAGKTWVYDATASLQLGEACWHERAAFENGAMSRHWANCFCFFNGQCVVGDYRNGNLYALDPAAQTDNGAKRKWLRSWRALAKPSEKPVSFKSLRIDMQTGVLVASGTEPQAPQIMLRWSDDGGNTWSPYRQRDAGQIGATANRVKWNQLGGTRRNHGLDRIFEISSTDAMGVRLIGAELE